MMTDTKIIEANFHTPIYFNLDVLDVDIDEIADYWIKWGTLYIVLNDGSELSFEATSSNEPDYKWPIHIQEWTEEYEESLRPIKEEERIIVEEEEIKEEED